MPSRNGSLLFRDGNHDIWDDSPKWINLEVKQAVDGKNQRTEVVIENVEI